MIKTKLIHLYYKVKNKTKEKRNVETVLHKEDPYNMLCNCSKGKEIKQIP